jgi:allophanate hydrolase
LIHDEKSGGGAAIEVEVWELEASAFGDFVSKIPEPLGIGKITLADGSRVPGFIAEPRALHGAEEITSFGGWRRWLARE